MNSNEFFAFVQKENAILFGSAVKSFQQAKTVNFSVKAGQRKPQKSPGVSSERIRAMSNVLPWRSLVQVTCHTIQLRVDFEIGRISSSSSKLITLHESNLEVENHNLIPSYNFLVKNSYLKPFGDYQILAQTL